MKVLTWNVNGLRAAERKGFLDWLAKTDADVVFLQEIKAFEEQLSDELRAPRGWHAEFFPAQRPGYSGTAVYSRERPDEVVRGLGDEAYDVEGRAIAARFGDLHLIGAYFPNGSRDHSRVPYKLGFYASMLRRANALRAAGLDVLVCGDWNTAHAEVDLARPKENQKTTGFLPEEREWVTKFLGEGWADAWRRLHPHARDRYTWWTAWGGARQKNIGWRIDYHVVDEGLLPRVQAAGIHEEIPGSDHCPATIEIGPATGPKGTRVAVTSTPAAPPASAPPSAATPPPKPPSAAKPKRTSRASPAPKSGDAAKPKAPAPPKGSRRGRT